MTDENDTWKDLMQDRSLMLGAALVAMSAAGFTVFCFLTSLVTDSVTAQLIVALLGAVLAPTGTWIYFQKGDLPTEELSPRSIWSGILITYGIGILLFPSACPAVADVFQRYIPSFIYYAVGISGAIAVCVFIGMMWLKFLMPLAERESQKNDGE